MDVAIPLFTCITSLWLGVLVCWLVMKQEREEMEKQMDGMMSTMSAYKHKLIQLTGTGNISMGNHTHGAHTAGSVMIPTNHAYYEDDSEIGSRVWMDYVTEPFVMDAAEALGLLQEGDVDDIEIVNGAGQVAMSFRGFRALANPADASAVTPVVYKTP